MVDVADVRLVDAHAEGDRGHDDAVLRLDEPVLRLAALVVLHAGVIGPRGEAGIGEPVGQLLGRSLQRDVNDRRPALAAGEGLVQPLVALGQRDGRAQQREVRPIEAGADRAVRLNLEEAADVASAPAAWPWR